MTPKSSYAIVGVFVLLLGALFVAGLLWLTTGGPPRDYDGYLVFTTESVSGLSVDSEVKYKGVNVGRVSELGLDPEYPERVRIMLLILKGTPVKIDTVAKLEHQGITGLAYINLDGGSRESKKLLPVKGAEFAIIPSSPSWLVSIGDAIPEVLASLKTSSERIGALLNEENLAMLSGALNNTQELTAELNGRAEELQLLLSNADQMINNMSNVTAGVPELIAQFERTASGLESMADSMAATGETLKVTSLDLQRTVNESGADVRGFTASSLPQLNALINELQVTASNLRQVSESVQSNPSRVLFGGPQPQPGPGEEGE